MVGVGVGVGVGIGVGRVRVQQVSCLRVGTGAALTTAGQKAVHRPLLLLLGVGVCVRLWGRVVWHVRLQRLRQA